MGDLEGETEQHPGNIAAWDTEAWGCQWASTLGGLSTFPLTYTCLAVELAPASLLWSHFVAGCSRFLTWTSWWFLWNIYSSFRIYVLSSCTCIGRIPIMYLLSCNSNNCAFLIQSCLIQWYKTGKKKPESAPYININWSPWPKWQKQVTKLMKNITDKARVPFDQSL